MAPKRKATYSSKGKGQATRGQEVGSNRDTEGNVNRLPEPGTDSDEFEPEAHTTSDSDGESIHEATATTETGKLRTILCVPCLKRMIKVPFNGRPEPCLLRKGGNFTACKACAEKGLGCKGLGEYVDQPLEQWDDDKRDEFVISFTNLAMRVKRASQQILNNQEVGEDWEKLTQTVQKYVDKVEAEKAKQEAHKQKAKYDKLREELEEAKAELKSIREWIDASPKLFVSKSVNDEWFVRFAAGAKLLGEMYPEELQEKVDETREDLEAGNEGTDDGDAADEDDDDGGMMVD
ncbi:hypothetical protein FGLOB1_2604 [Fusarium globosum]|uniref:Uncharacterized protein n=1 Tax=Fusarium globosum TaxID=78864 RepID=A0A8H6DGU1_9HYPO|nr:hypothetical protein FGLOB1_2604 [Fusarium globosum]